MTAHRMTAADALLTALAEQDRRVLAPWRALVLLRRATLALPASSRRWTTLPATEADLSPLLRQMAARGQIKPLPRDEGLYQVTVPYADRVPFDEHEVLFEVHPYAILSHLSAQVFHNLTYQLPKELIVTIPADGIGDLLPMDSDASDWEGIPLVRGRRPARVMGQPVRWTRVAVDRLFGHREYRPQGYPIRVTTPERTLLDGLLAPERSGGIENVLGAWVHARDTLNLDVLTHLVDRLGIGVLRQRVGYILDQLGRTHPRVEEWRHQAQRGGSSRLHGAAPYAPVYDQDWSLSLNAPVDVLHPESA